MDKIKIVIVDDHKIMIAGIRAMLIGNNQVQIIGEANNAKSLFNLLDKGTIPDVLLLDIKLGGNTNGIDICHSVKSSNPKVKSLMLSANTEEKYIIAALKAGAKGFLSKSCQKDELLEAVDAVKRDKMFFGKDISDTVISSYIRGVRGDAEFGDNPLSTREFEIAKLLVENYSAKQIGETLSISPRTVESHKHNILDKLGLKSTIDLVKYAIKHEWVEL